MTDRPNRRSEPQGTRAESRRSRVPMLMLVPLLFVVALAATACADKTTPTPAQTAGQLITSGLKAESSGNTQGALSDFQMAAADDPTDAFAYYDIGVIYQTKLNEPTQAAAAYQKSLLADSTYKPALFNLAILDTSTNPAQAISEYQQILNLNPNDTNTLFNLGLLLIGQNQSAQGHADLAKAIMLNPKLASRVPTGITP
jgi:tetratricopeptide (TPR) repeat protein